MIEITVNGVKCLKPDGMTVSELAADIGLPEQGGTAIAVNDRLIPRSKWAGVHLVQKDDVVIIKAAYGG